MVVAAAEADDPPTPARAEAAASRRLYSSTWGFSSFSRSVISRRFSSRKSVTEYVRLGYDQAVRQNRQYLGFLMLLNQRMVTSSTRAIATRSAAVTQSW